MALIFVGDIKNALVKQGWHAATYQVPSVGSLWVQSQEEILLWNGGSRKEIIEIPFSLKPAFFTKYTHSTGNQTLILVPERSYAYIYNGSLPGSFRPDAPTITVSKKSLAELLP
jgi:hypothetical protein